MPIADAPNLNHCWSRLLVEELVRCGVSAFVLSPGSRSTPLTMAVVDNPRAEHVMHFDERGAAFYALGRAKALGRPVALVCTSGSAVANYWPAVVEASINGVPLLLLTADRPPELLRCGANQAIDQIRIFGDQVRTSVELPCPDNKIPAAYVLATVNEAYARTLSPASGPVHVNCAFREPLAPVSDGADLSDWLAPIASWMNGSQPLSTRVVTAGTPDVEALLSLIESHSRGIIVAGELREDEDRLQVLRLARVLGWPVLPDLTSGLRLGEPSDQVLHHYDVLLLSETVKSDFQPELVLHVGGRFVSKRLLQHLDKVRPLYVHVDAHPARVDPNLQVTHRVVAPVATICGTLAESLAGAEASGWARRFFPANTAVAKLLEDELAENGLTEPGIANAIAKARPEGSLLFAGNSLPVRELDSYATAAGAWGVDTANRGASGIDGNIATATGYADARQVPATFLLGDLTTLHDLNSLALLRGQRRPTAMVVLNNNDGGGIFSFLPVAEHEAHFEACFGTPHGMGFEHAARQFGLEYAKPRSLDAFEDEYRHAMSEDCTTLIEVCTNRAENVQMQRALQARIAAAVETML